ncbi:MAG: hypothetical protein F4X75_13565 [Gemmatimonadetes bacterium]|nr:hypothetical protein [Gemmatimonadota bacterium]
MNNEINDPILPEPKTEAAKQARKNFERQLKEQERQEQQIAFSILIWGMSPEKNDPIVKKRKDIGTQLLEDGHNAMFSEDLTNLSNDRDRSEKSNEFAQANAADLVIILIEDSPSALAEACDFCNHPDLAPKIYVMAPNSYKTGYAGQGALQELDEGYGGVYWYQEGEVEACHLLTQASKRVKARRSMAYRHKTRESN